MPKLILAVTALLLGGSLGCSDQSTAITVQEVPKGSESIRPDDQAASTAAPSSPASAYGTHGNQPSASAQPLWTTPTLWQRVDEERPMRYRTYLAPIAETQVEVAISHFPGDVGGMLANINRWRGQIGLAAISEAEAEAMIDRFTNPGFAGYTVHLQGAEAHMLVGSIYQESEDRTWFVRALVSPEQAPRLRPDLFTMVRSFDAVTDDY